MERPNVLRQVGTERNDNEGTLVSTHWTFVTFRMSLRSILAGEKFATSIGAGCARLLMSQRLQVPVQVSEPTTHLVTIIERALESSDRPTRRSFRRRRNRRCARLAGSMGIKYRGDVIRGNTVVLSVGIFVNIKGECTGVNMSASTERRNMSCV